MDEAKRSKLWEKYSQKQDSETREALIIEYVPLVKLVSGRLSMYLGYTVEYEDLVSYGIFGLIDAIDKFDYRKGIKFETYASLRSDFRSDSEDGLDSKVCQAEAKAD